MLAAHFALPLRLLLHPPAMFCNTALLGPRRMAPSEMNDDDDEIVVALSVQSILLHRPAAVSSLVRRARTGGSHRGRR